MNRILSSTLALAIAVAPVSAYAAEPATSLEIDLSELPDDEITRGLETRLREHQRDTLSRGGVEIRDDAEHRIEVTVRRYGEDNLHYEADVVLYLDQASTPDVSQKIQCELCRDSELVAKVGEEVARLSGRILYAPTDDEQTAAVEPEPSPPEPDDQNESVKPIGALGGIGIVLGVAGLATTIAGGVDLARGEVATNDDPGTQFGTVTDHRPRGRVLVGVGVGALVVGAVMIGVDVGLRGKKRRSRRAARLQLDAGPDFVGTSIRGRF